MVYIIDKNNDVEGGVKEIMERTEGSYSDVCLYGDKLIVFRDPLALRPLVWGENEDFICFASETVALDTNGIPYKGEVRGGELVTINGGKMERKQLVPEKPKHCMFEYVYFSRPDSTINSVSVHEARSRLGQILAEESPAEADVVIPVPDTSRTAASAYAKALGVPYEEGLMKNRYIGRTFIMPSQEKRVEAVKVKLNPVKEIVEGKSVVLIDDSIVRGTTLREIVTLVRNVGAKAVHLRITCPPVRAPCFYGVDMSTYKELIAHKKTVEEIRDYLGADSLSYVSLEGLKRSIGLPICTACLTEEYHTDYVRELARKEKEG
jgi:amidophosphoribosyltransferase